RVPAGFRIERTLQPATRRAQPAFPGYQPAGGAGHGQTDRWRPRRRDWHAPCTPDARSPVAARRGPGGTMEPRERRREQVADEPLDAGEVPGGEWSRGLGAERPEWGPGSADTRPIDAPDAGRREGEARRLELREEQMVAHKDLRHLGDVVVRTEVED